jgi:hypothetical protein
MLLSKNIVTGISEMQLDMWLSNFVTDEDQYLAARLLENLTFRSEQMVGSAIEHILQSILPCELRRLGNAMQWSVDEFISSINAGGQDHPIRFVEIDDPRGKLPGKSGSVIIRELHRLGGVAKQLTCQPQNLALLPSTVRCLIFVDDMLGTGTQFIEFAKTYKLEKYCANKDLIYCPLAAYSAGILNLKNACPWLNIFPVEEFSEKHRFFRASSENPSLWAIDHVNKVDDVRQHVNSLYLKAGISRNKQYALELLIGFHHATPNNTMPIMYEDTATWSKLLTR